MEHSCINSDKAAMTFEERLRKLTENGRNIKRSSTAFCNCRACGNCIDEQDGYDPDAGYWDCGLCGQRVFAADVYLGERYLGTMWHCTGCGSLLNRQEGFSDGRGIWKCLCCGNENAIDEASMSDAERAFRASMSE